jgi:inhibitor of KinA sporulation pathway (predicted exonuclease)
MKNQFSHVYNIKHCGVSKALKFLNLKFDGTQHRGIDDAKNMAIIYKTVKDRFFEKIYDHD